MKKIFLALIFFAFANSCLGHKILVFVQWFPDPFQTFVLDDVIALMNKGHEVNIYAIQKKNLSYLNLMPKRFHEYKLDKYVYYAGDESTRNFLLNNEFDFFYSPLGEPASHMITVKHNFNLNPKIFVGLQGHDIIFLLENQAPERREIIYNSVDMFLPVCKYFFDKLTAAGFSSDKITLYYTGIDESRLKPKNSWDLKKHSTFLSVGRLVERKGFEYSIKAFAKIVDKFPKAQYLIIGEGDYENYLLTLIKSLGLVGKVKLLGSKTPDEIPYFLSKADIFIVPSVIGSNKGLEGIPNVLKEAMFSKLPCVGTIHSGISEMIENNITGLLVLEKNIDQLAFAMESLLESRNLREKLGRNAYQFVFENFRRINQDEFLGSLFKKDS